MNAFRDLEGRFSIRHVGEDEYLVTFQCGGTSTWTSTRAELTTLLKSLECDPSDIARAVNGRVGKRVLLENVKVSAKEREMLTGPPAGETGTETTEAGNPSSQSCSQT